MPEQTKKQHYIPRNAYLRRFSNTRNEKDHNNALIVYDKLENRAYTSNVYDCGFKNYFYEYDGISTNSIEKKLSDVDAGYVAFFDRIEQICNSDLNHNALILSQTKKRF